MVPLEAVMEKLAILNVRFMINSMKFFLYIPQLLFVPNKDQCLTWLHPVTHESSEVLSLEVTSAYMQWYNILLPAQSIPYFLTAAPSSWLSFFGTYMEEHISRVVRRSFFAVTGPVKTFPSHQCNCALFFLKNCIKVEQSIFSLTLGSLQIFNNR